MKYYPNFNMFYEKNRTEIDKYIWSTVWKYQHILEPEDMFQEVVYRLAKSSFLKDWNEKKAALNTYFTGRVRGYTLHIITKRLKELCIKKKNEILTEPPISFVRLNKQHEHMERFDLDMDNPSPYSYEIKEEPRGEEELFLKEIKNLFKKKISSLQAFIYEMHYWNELTYHEIMVVLNQNDEDKVYSYNFIRNKCIQAIDIMLNILSSEGVYSGK